MRNGWRCVSCIGLGFQRGTHPRWQLVSNDASGAPTLVDMGASFAIALVVPTKDGDGSSLPH